MNPILEIEGEDRCEFCGVSALWNDDEKRWDAIHAETCLWTAAVRVNGGER
jgi:hypothetical protein